MEVGVYGVLMFFGIVLLVVGVIGVIAGEVRRGAESVSGNSGDQAEATFSSSAVRIMGQPALVFGICCLVMAFAVGYVARSRSSNPAESENSVKLGTVAKYVDGGAGAVLATIPYGQAVQLFNGEVVLRDRGGPEVSGAQLCKQVEGPYTEDRISRNPGEQCFMQLGDGRIFRVNLLSREMSGPAVFSIHAVDQR